MAPLLAGVFAGRGKDAAVFRGDDGLDELTVSTTSRVWWVRQGQVLDRRVDPRRVGLSLHPVEALRGGDAAHNAQVLRDVFAGQVGAVRDAVLLNAGIALALTRPDSGPTQEDFENDLRAAMGLAAATIDNGSVTELVSRWAAATRAPSRG
jgi:anthranilate phosphoribosyltransferase